MSGAVLGFRKKTHSSVYVAGVFLALLAVLRNKPVLLMAHSLYID